MAYGPTKSIEDTMSKTTTLNPAIHAAFRRDLRRFDDALDALDVDDSPRVRQLNTAWDNFSYQLHRHHQDEESFFWPAFHELGVDSSIVDRLEGEHVGMVAALDVADRAMRVFRTDTTYENTKAARIAIAELHQILHEHLAHEERDLDPFSVQHKYTKQHKAAEAAARKAHTEGAGTFFAWLSDRCDARTSGILRREVPAPLLWLVVHIGGRRYRRDIAPIWS